MIDVKQNSRPHLNILNQYIKDLSYENPQSAKNIQSGDKKSDISLNVNAFFKSYDNDCISVSLKIACSSSFEKTELFILELDYCGFFKIINNDNFSQEIITNEAVRLIFPFARSIIANITQNGGSTPVLLDNLDFSVSEKISQ